MRLPDLIQRLRGRRAETDAVHAAYAAIVGQARDPELYARFAVPDTPEGRLEALMLHAYLVMRRLRSAADAERPAFSQALFDLMVQDMDQNLREMGVGDTVVGKRVKRLVKGFYGRIALYDRALEAGEAAPDPLAAALAETLHDADIRDDDETPPAAAADALAAYVRRQIAVLDGQPAADILAGRPRLLSTADAVPTRQGVPT